MIDSPLLSEIKGFIGGSWQDATSGQTDEVINPATGEILACVPSMGKKETGAAIDAAAMALEQGSDVGTRRAWLTGMAECLREHREELSRIVILESGKTVQDSYGELDYSMGFFEYFSRNLDVLESRTIPGMIRDCTWKVHHRPAGVACMIVPWNFPLAMLAKKIPAALGAGCSIVLKPDEHTPLSAIAFFHLLQEIKLPAGQLNLVLGKGEEIGKVMCTHPAVRILSFTGSTEVGRILSAQTAPHIKRLTMELGGNAPFIVFDDAEIEAAADALMPNKFRGSGQTCVCTNRVYVQAGVADAFCDAVVERVSKIKAGDGSDPESGIGPLINRDGFDKVARHVEDALAKGAERVYGEPSERPDSESKAFFNPVVLRKMSPDMLVCREETFGPVVAMAEFKDEEEVVRLANASDHGLAAYVFTEDEKRINRMLPRLAFGHVGVNTGTGPTPEAPFGGVKQSGYGREGGGEGLLEFTECQTVAVHG